MRPGETETEFCQIRKTQSGGVLLKLARCGDQRVLQSSIEQALGPAARVRARVLLTRVEILDLNCCTSKEELAAAVARDLGETLMEEAPKVSLAVANAQEQHRVVVELEKAMALTLIARMGELLHEALGRGPTMLPVPGIWTHPAAVQRPRLDQRLLEVQGLENIRNGLDSVIPDKTAIKVSKEPRLLCTGPCDLFEKLATPQCPERGRGTTNIRRTSRHWRLPTSRGKALNPGGERSAHGTGQRQQKESPSIKRRRKRWAAPFSGTKPAPGRYSTMI